MQIYFRPEMGIRIELRTRHCRQNAQNFGAELLDQVPGPKFQKRKINIHLKTALKEVSIYKVFLSNGKSINTNTIISTIGTSVSNVIKQSGLPLRNGKIISSFSSCMS